MILVDDGSKDGSWRQIEALVGEGRPRARPEVRSQLRRDRRQRRRHARARGKYVMTMDADLQNDPKDIPAFLKALETRRRLRLRHARGRRAARGTTSSASPPAASPTGSATSSSDEQITDAGCTYRCIQRECVDQAQALSRPAPLHPDAAEDGRVHASSRSRSPTTRASTARASTASGTASSKASATCWRSAG